MYEKYTDDEDYIKHSFEDMYSFAKKSGNQILMNYIEAVRSSIVTVSKNQNYNTPVDASLEIVKIFDTISEDHPSRQYFLDWKDELLLYLSRLRSANKSGMQFTIW